MSQLKGLRELDFALYSSLISLYLQNPLDHAYMLYDLIYELDKTELYISGRGDVVEAYMLIWRGQKHAEKLWNYSEDFKQPLREALSAIIQLYWPSDLEKVAGVLKEAGVEFRAEVYLDMAAVEERYRPYRPQEAVRLDPRRHVGEFVELKKAQGADIDEGQAVELLKKRRCYGVFKDGRLVSIACRHAALPEAGDVYTLPEYRALREDSHLGDNERRGGLRGCGLPPRKQEKCSRNKPLREAGVLNLDLGFSPRPSYTHTLAVGRTKGPILL